MAAACNDLLVAVCHGNRYEAAENCDDGDGKPYALVELHDDDDGEGWAGSLFKKKNGISNYFNFVKISILCSNRLICALIFLGKYNYLKFSWIEYKSN